MTDNNQSMPGDRIIKCRDCPESFVFTEGEQKFFASKELSDPTRCKACRAARKAQQQGGGFAPTRYPSGPNPHSFEAPPPKAAAPAPGSNEVDVLRKRPNKKVRRRDRDEDY